MEKLGESLVAEPANAAERWCDGCRRGIPMRQFGDEPSSLAQATPVTAIAWVATYAAIVGTASLVVAVLAYRSGAPRLRPSTHLRPGQDDRPAELRIVVKNGGRAPGEVAGIELTVPGPHTISLGGDGNPALYGPALGGVVPAHSTRTWTVTAPELLAVTNRNGWPHQVRAVIVLGDLRREWESIHKYTNLLSG